MVNLIYLINQGEKFTDEEKETLFFSTSKLLHSADVSLRRLIFLFVKELNFWQNSFILTGSLITEINRQGDNLIKPNCFRILGQIIDMSSVSVVERLLKEAISNSNPEIASSALICTLFMVNKGFNVAKNWISEITDKLTSSLGQENLLTFHCLLLLRQIKEKDKLFLIKIYSRLAEDSNSKSQFGLCQLIRYITEFLRKEELDSETFNTFSYFLERCTYKIEESVKIEACRAILSLKNIKPGLKKSALATLCELINSVNKVVKFSAMKTFDKYVEPSFAQTLALDIFMEIERTIEDNSYNSSIKAYGLSIFLKISKELSENRTEKMFKTFIEQYPKFKDDFKKKVIVISKGICQEIPDKQKIYFKFFCEIFKLDAGPQTKSEILEAILWFIDNNKELKNQAILFLAEMIFDCQYDVIKVKILSLLGKECLNANPAKLVRYIYNQIILETPMVRASAIAALGEIAFKEENLRKTILILIKRSFNDSDAEVRERAFFYYKAINNLNSEEENLKNSKITNFVFPSLNEKENNFFNNLDVDIIQSILKIEKETLLNSENISDELTNILNNKEKVEEILIQNKKELEKLENKKDGKKKEKKKDENKEEIAEDEYKQTMFSKVYGTPKIITNYKKLTEQTAEYFTRYRKIIHDSIVVFDFEITNTVELQTINNITMEIENLNNEGFDFDKAEIIQIKSLASNQTGHLYFKILKNSDILFSSCSFQIILNFDLQELDIKGNSHGIAVKETFKIDKIVDISYADYYKNYNKVNLENFSEFWKMAEKSGYSLVQEKIGLPYHNMKEAAKNFSEIIGLNPLNKIEKIDNSVKKFEIDYAYQSYTENLLFLKLQIIFNDQNKCLALVTILSQDESIPKIILNKIYA